jgi:hypothetical protein
MRSADIIRKLRSTSGTNLLVQGEPVFIKPENVQDDERISFFSRFADRDGCLWQFDDVRLTWESSPVDPGTVEQNYYAERVGFILGVKAKGGNERTELVQITTNNPD